MTDWLVLDVKLEAVDQKQKTLKIQITTLRQTNRGRAHLRPGPSDVRRWSLYRLAVIAIREARVVKYPAPEMDVRSYRSTLVVRIVSTFNIYDLLHRRKRSLMTGILWM